MKSDFYKNASQLLTITKSEKARKYPLWLRNMALSLGGFTVPFGAVFLSFLGMLSWSLFYDLDGVDMNVWDESLFALRAYRLYENGSFLQNFNQYTGLYDHPSTKLPFVTLIQAFSFQIFGPSVLSLRLPIGFTAIVCSLLITRILFRLGIGSKWGLLVCILMTCSLSFMGEHMLRTGDHDAPLAYFLLLAGLYFFEYLKMERVRSLWGLGFWFLAALLTKNILAGVVVPAWILFAFVSGKGISLIKDVRIYRLGALVLSLFALVLFGFEWAYPGFLDRMWNYELMGRYTNVIEGHTGPWYYYINLLIEKDNVYVWVVVLSGLLLLLNRYVSKAGDPRNNLAFTLGDFLFITVLVYGTVISLSKTKLPWYHAPIFPLFSVLAVLGIRSTLVVCKSLVWKSVIKIGLVCGLLVFWCTVGVKAHSRSTIFGTEGFLTLFDKLKAGDLLLPQTYIFEDDFGSDTYFYAKSFEENATNTQFSFVRELDSIEVGSAIMGVKPWILARVEEKYVTQSILKLGEAEYRKIISVR